MSATNPWPLTEVLLLDRICDPRDEDAWRNFVDLYGGPLYRLCRRCGLQDADAAEVVQCVFVRVSRGVHRFEPDPGRARFRTWLRTIATREIHSFRRQAGTRPAPLDEAREIERHAEWDADCQTAILQCALDRVRSDCDEASWLAFELVWRFGVKPPEAAARLGRRVQWVYKTKHKVVVRLRREVDRLISDEFVPTGEGTQ